MALLKFLKGNASALPSTSKEGWIYVTQDTADMYIFKTDTDRLHLNANYANKLRVENTLNTGLDVGDSDLPVYFLDGVPTVTTGVATSTALSNLASTVSSLSTTVETNAAAAKNASNLISGTMPADRLPTSGVIANTYGAPATTNTLSHGGNFSVPRITVDAYGRITSAETKSYTLPSLNLNGAISNIVNNNLSGGYALVSDNSGKITTLSSVTSTELGYLGNVSSDIQAQLNAKQATITGGATTITTSNLTGSRALISNGSGKVAVSTVTSTELEYLSGVTSNIQTQITNLKNAAASSASKVSVTASNSGWIYLTGVSSSTSTTNGTSTSSTLYITAASSTSDGPRIDLANKALYGAVWNDYAECRETKEDIKPGRVVCETGKGDLVLSTERLQAGANIISDTFGFIIGETSKAKTPIAVSGRVLAYPLEDRILYAAGDAVCAGPNGTVSIMTREEIREYPDRILGTVSEIPDYEVWGENDVVVNGRIWIKVR